MTDKIIVAVAGDLHVNSTVALCPPRFTLDDGGDYVSSPQQRWIWRHWLSYWKKVEEAKRLHNATLYTIFTGELADDLNHRSTQLITKNNTDQMKLAHTAIKPALDITDHVFVMRGTEAHSNSSGSLDEKIADDIGAIQDGKGNSSWFSMIADIGRVRFDVAHHPGHGHARPWTRGGDANRLAADMLFRYAEINERLPDLVIRGHVHKPVDSYDNHAVRAIIHPSWQLNNAFGHRLGGGWLPIGGLYVVCHGDGTYEVHKDYKRWNVKKDIWNPRLLPKTN